MQTLNLLDGLLYWNCDMELLDWRSLMADAKVEGNYQRKRVHQLDPQLATGIRLIVHATNGDKSMKVFEVRVYE
ncbi:MAG: hypothetical protein NZ937_09225 [Armatimonadetes bacterium]|nr:hypothetical protein [Armatimonadota bacterium]